MLNDITTILTDESKLQLDFLKQTALKQGPATKVVIDALIHDGRKAQLTYQNSVGRTLERDAWSLLIKHSKKYPASICLKLSAEQGSYFLDKLELFNSFPAARVTYSETYCLGCGVDLLIAEYIPRVIGDLHRGILEKILKIN
jgi:hypothetical protein